MSDPILDRDALDECLRLVATEAAEYLARVDEALVRPVGSPEGIGGALPDEGAGSLAALRTLVEAADAEPELERLADVKLNVDLIVPTTLELAATVRPG